MSSTFSYFEFVIFLFLLMIISDASVYGDNNDFISEVEDSLVLKEKVKLLFSEDEILNISIHFDDMKCVKRDISDQAVYHNARLVLHTSSIENQSFKIKIKTRGHYRKDPVNCNFPPLKIDFEKDQVKNTIFAGQNKLKLVTHCKNGRSEYEQYVIQEYLAYKLYNILTENSYKVRLARIHYFDNAGRCESIMKYAFFIEDTDDMAARNACKKVGLTNVPQNYTDYYYQNLLSVFQYMIGNTDWSVPAMHNIKLILEKPGLRPVPIPYDFDWTGIVNPAYAIPSKQLGIKTVEERLFRGYERSLEDFYRVFEYIFSKKEEIFQLYSSSILIDDQKNRSLNYLNDFFSIISNEKLIEREFVQSARKNNHDYLYGK